jgi:hypothetical protein
MSIRAKFITALVLFFALLVGVWFLLQPQPAQILSDAKRKFLTSRSLTYDLTFDLKGAVGPVLFGTTSAQAPGNLHGQVKSSIDLSKYPYASDSTWHFDVSGTGAHDGTWIGESRKQDAEHYFRLDSSASTTQTAALRTGEWYRTATPILLQMLAKPKTEQPAYTAKTAAALRQALIDADWLKFASRLPDVKTADGPQYHFRVSLDDDAMTAVFIKIKEALQGPDDLRNSEADQIAATLAVAAWNDPTGEILISQKDGLPRRLTFTAKVSGEHGEVDVNFAADFSGYGQRVNVVIPEALDLDQASDANAQNQILAPSGTRDSTGSASTTIATPDFNFGADKLQNAVDALVNNLGHKPASSATGSRL